MRPRDNRGVTAVAFGVSAAVVIGVVGLGTEGGTWYLTRRDAQNAADPAAYAGAVRLSFVQTALPSPYNAYDKAKTQAENTAWDTSTRNGFTDGQANTRVWVHTPPESGPNTGNITAVEVIVERTPPRLISGIFLTTNPVIRARGVAALTANGQACVLALNIGLIIQGNSTTATGCSLASNATSGTAINVNGNPAINAPSLISSGGCNGCTGLPFQTYQPPTTDPYAALNTISYSKPTTCLPIPPKTGSSRTDITAPTAGQGFCGDLALNGGTWNFAPGTYVFWESSLKVTGGSITCTLCSSGGPGVTFIFTADPKNPNKVGTVDINTNETVTLSAPDSGTYAGVLIYRDDLGTCSGVAEIQITGGPTMTLTGAIYAPTSCTNFSGNSGTNCLVMVASQVTLSGTSNFSSSGCPTNPGVPTTQVVRLVE